MFYKRCIVDFCFLDRCHFFFHYLNWNNASCPILNHPTCFMTTIITSFAYFFFVFWVVPFLLHFVCSDSSPVMLDMSVLFLLLFCPSVAPHSDHCGGFPPSSLLHNKDLLFRSLAYDCSSYVRTHMLFSCLKVHGSLSLDILEWPHCVFPFLARINDRPFVENHNAEIWPDILWFSFFVRGYIFFFCIFFKLLYIINGCLISGAKTEKWAQRKNLMFIIIMTTQDVFVSFIESVLFLSFGFFFPSYFSFWQSQSVILDFQQPLWFTVSQTLWLLTF